MSPVYKLGHRMSSLPVTAFCGQAGVLSQIGAGRAAAQSSAFHALCAGGANKNELFMRLTEAEAEEIMTWHKPSDVDLGNGLILRYADAVKETEVALDRYGSYIDPSKLEAITKGHPDFYWIVTVGNRRIAYVGDIKRSEWTVSDGVESLQLHAYALAVATLHDCDGYAVGLWAAVEAQWQWSGIIELFSNEAVNYARRVVAAALNTSVDYATGAHCRGCYGRLRCPAWLVAPSDAHTELAPIAIGQSPITADNAKHLLLTFQRFMDTAKAVEQHLKEFAVRNRGIEDGKGKVWKPIVCQGKESVSVTSVRTLLADVDGPHVPVERVAKLIKQGSPYEQFRWVNK